MIQAEIVQLILIDKYNIQISIGPTSEVFRLGSFMQCIRSDFQ